MEKFVLPSDEDLHDLNFVVCTKIVKHYLNPRDNNTVKEKIDLLKLMEGLQVKATPVDLNSHLVYIAVNNTSTGQNGGRIS